MKDVLKNRKGFTLVELLAVIVVLAIIILIAMPAVLSAMEKARKNALKTEASEIVKVAQTAYTALAMENKISGTKYCFSIKYLADNKFMEKTINTNTDHGSVLITLQNDRVDYKVWLSNGSYYINGAASTNLPEPTLGSPSSTEASVYDNCNAGCGDTSNCLNPTFSN